jgi:hypothetical protein
MLRKFDGLSGRLFIWLLFILRILNWRFSGFGEEASHNESIFLLLKNIAYKQ